MNYQGVWGVNRLAAVSLLCALLAFTTGCSTVSGWFSDDEVDPTAPVELTKIEQKVKIKKLWSVGVGNGQGKGLHRIRPVLDQGIIYAASTDGTVKALSAEKGKSLWKKSLDVSLSGGVGVYEDALFVGSSEGFVLRLDASSGEVLWSTQLRGEVLAPPQGNGKVVVAQTYDSNVPVLTIRGTSAPILRDNVVYAGFANGRVLAFDASTGAIEFEVRVAISQGRSEIERIVDVDGSMVLVGDNLYAASYQGRLVGIDVANGRKDWQQDISCFSGVSHGFGNVYAADEDGTVYAFLATGAGVRWAQGDLGYRELSRPTPVSSFLAVADFEGYLHIMSQVDGELIGRVKVDGDGARADMVSDGNRLYVFGNSGKLVAYEVTAKK
jgi:outer membrane protein assembly factor BamB